MSLYFNYIFCDPPYLIDKPNTALLRNLGLRWPPFTALIQQRALTQTYNALKHILLPEIGQIICKNILRLLLRDYREKFAGCNVAIGTNAICGDAYSHAL